MCVHDKALYKSTFTFTFTLSCPDLIHQKLYVMMKSAALERRFSVGSDDYSKLELLTI